jgi:hypothetical protein
LQVTDNKISIYGEGEIEQKTWMDNVAKIKKAFPKIKPEWIDILAERIKDKGFTNERFDDAVNKMIDTCPYPEPTIAEVLNYDHRVECLSQMEFLDKRNRQGVSLESEYTKADINGDLHYVKNKDFKEYGFTKFIPKAIKIEHKRDEITEEERKKTSEHLKNALEVIKANRV